MNGWITRVKRCPDCRGTGVSGYTRFLDVREPIRCETCLGNGQILFTVREEEQDLSRLQPAAGARP